MHGLAACLCADLHVGILSNLAECSHGMPGSQQMHAFGGNHPRPLRPRALSGGRPPGDLTLREARRAELGRRDPALSATFRHALTFLTGIHCVSGSDAALIAIEPADPLSTNAVCYASDRKGDDQYERGHGQRRKPGTESAGPAAVTGKDRAGARRLGETFPPPATVREKRSRPIEPIRRQTMI
jgi:hypothetical protein